MYELTFDTMMVHMARAGCEVFLLPPPSNKCLFASPYDGENHSVHDDHGSREMLENFHRLNDVA